VEKNIFLPRKFTDDPDLAAGKKLFFNKSLPILLIATVLLGAVYLVRK
jgi:hypothetical protein